MNYIENTYVCLAAPLLLAILCLRKDARRLAKREILFYNVT